MRVSRPNTAFHRDINEKYEAEEHEDCPICGKPIYWPYEAVDWDKNDEMCHLRCLERKENGNY